MRRPLWKRLLAVFDALAAAAFAEAGEVEMARRILTGDAPDAADRGRTR